MRGLDGFGRVRLKPPILNTKPEERSYPLQLFRGSSWAELPLLPKLAEAFDLAFREMGRVWEMCVQVISQRPIFPQGRLVEIAALAVDDERVERVLQSDGSGCFLWLDAVFKVPDKLLRFLERAGLQTLSIGCANQRPGCPERAPALLADPVLSELAAASMAAVDRKH